MIMPSVDVNLIPCENTQDNGCGTYKISKNAEEFGSHAFVEDICESAVKGEGEP